VSVECALALYMAMALAVLISGIAALLESGFAVLLESGTAVLPESGVAVLLESGIVHFRKVVLWELPGERHCGFQKVLLQQKVALQPLALQPFLKFDKEEEKEVKKKLVQGQSFLECIGSSLSMK